MKTYSAIWETGGTVFSKQSGKDLYHLVPNGFRPTGKHSRRKDLKDIPHDIFVDGMGRKLIVMEDIDEKKP